MLKHDDKYTLIEIVDILIGKIEPIGETHVDTKVEKNLENSKEIVGWLFTVMLDNAYNGRKAHQASIKKCGKSCEDFIEVIKESILEYEQDIKELEDAT